MREIRDDILRWFTRGDRVALATVVATRRSAPRPIGAKLAISARGERVGDAPEEVAERAPQLIHEGRSGVIEIGDHGVFAEVYGPPPRPLIYGAVDTAEALCRAARAIGWRPIVADARARFATSERLPSAEEVVVAWPEEALTRVRPEHTTAVVVLTHDDKFDVPMISGALATDAFYVGALGSRRNQERRRKRLLEAGVDEAAVERVSGPCGLDIGAQTPAETAVSILADILAVRAGRKGGRLREATARIHAEV